MADFFRFPQTPHLAWLGEMRPRGDKLLSPVETTEMLRGVVVVEEKVDGANLGLSVDEHHELRAQNRGQYLDLEAERGQFKPLARWLATRRGQLTEALFPSLILFGEWCYAVHSTRYSRLPDWFLAFDVYDRSKEEFWSTRRRNALVAELGLASVPRVATGHFDLNEICGLLDESELTDGPAEGLVVRRDDGRRLAMRAKIVRSAFVQSIGEHWSRRPLQTNALKVGSE